MIKKKNYFDNKKEFVVLLPFLQNLNEFLTAKKRNKTIVKCIYINSNH